LELRRGRQAGALKPAARKRNGRPSHRQQPTSATKSVENGNVGPSIRTVDGSELGIVLRT
jgi:hypothetical protein